MENNKYSSALTAIFLVLVATLGWTYLVYGTTIGANISTVDITASGNATTTGDFVVQGDTTLATTTATNVNIGSGTIVTKLMHSTVLIDPPSIATSSTGLATATVSGATADMECFVQSPWNLHDDLIPKGCTTTADVIGVYLYNPDQTSGGSAINDTSKTWGYFLIK